MSSGGSGVRHGARLARQRPLSSAAGLRRTSAL